MSVKTNYREKKKQTGYQKNHRNCQEVKRSQSPKDKNFKKEYNKEFQGDVGRHKKH